ncbi:hypothetical protein F5Y17DRAFT_463895 [Xylariaceae sp. FL0594]|nr:hypothetical protein F5Y17DRAFT_463895 [Xylariaceae sp. FL0594]
MGRKTKFAQKGLEMYHGIAQHIAKHDIHRLGPEAHSFLSGERTLVLATTSKGESDQKVPSTVEKLPSRITGGSIRHLESEIGDVMDADHTS